MLVFVIGSLFTIILLLIFVVTSHATSSASTPDIASSVNSTYPTSKASTTANLTNQKDKNNLTSTFEITHEIKELVDERVEKN